MIGKVNILKMTGDRFPTVGEGNSRSGKEKLEWTLWTRSGYWCGVMVFNTCCCCLVASVVSHSLRPYGPQPARIVCLWNSPGKNTGVVGCHALLQGISKPRDQTWASALLADSLPLSHQGSPFNTYRVIIYKCSQSPDLSAERGE